MPLPCAVAFADERLRIAQRKMESTLGSFELKPFAAPKTTSWSWHRGGASVAMTSRRWDGFRLMSECRST